jgi:hypothetical protein
LQHLSHSDPHGVDQKLRRLIGAQDHDRGLRVLSRDILDQLEISDIATHAVDNDQIGLLLIGHHTDLAHATFMQGDDVLGARCLELAADLLQ